MIFVCVLSGAPASYCQLKYQTCCLHNGEVHYSLLAASITVNAWLWTAACTGRVNRFFPSQLQTSISNVNNELQSAAVMDPCFPSSFSLSCPCTDSCSIHCNIFCDLGDAHTFQSLGNAVALFQDLLLAGHHFWSVIQVIEDSAALLKLCLTDISVSGFTCSSPSLSAIPSSKVLLRIHHKPTGIYNRALPVFHTVL